MAALRLSPSAIAASPAGVGNAIGASNVQLLHLDALEKLRDGPGFDALVSFRFLHISPPPLAALLLRHALRKLRPRGVAFFEVITYRKGYRFSVKEYLSQQTLDDEPEMHVVPQYLVFDILQESGCVPLELREDRFADDFATFSSIILAQKKDAPGKKRSPIPFWLRPTASDRREFGTGVGKRSEMR